MSWLSRLAQTAEKIREGVKVFSNLRTAFAVDFTMRRVAELRIEGRYAEAQRLMEAAVGLEGEDYMEPPRALSKIRNRIDAIDPSLTLLFFMQLTTFLVDNRNVEAATALHEADAGLEPSDYRDPVLVARKLASRLEDVPEELGSLYILRLANVLGLADRDSDQLVVAETLFGLKEKDYLDPSRLATLLEKKLAGFDPMLRGLGIPLLAAALGKAGRETESAAVVSVGMGLDADGRISPDIIAEKQKGGEDLRSMSAIFEGMILAGKSEIRKEAGLEALEEGFGLTADDYRKPDHLILKLRERAKDLPFEFMALAINSFLASMRNAGRDQDALALLLADAGLHPEELRDPIEVAGRLRKHYQGLPPNVAAFYLITACSTLQRTGLPHIAAVVLEQEAGLAVAEWSDLENLTRQVDAGLEGLETGTKGLYIYQLIAALAGSDQWERATLLADSFVRGMFPLLQSQKELSLAPHLCDIFDIWLRGWGRDASRGPLTVCSSVVSHLRGALAEQGVTLVDRMNFVRSVSDLRQRIIDTGLYWARQEGDPEKARRIALSVQLWDAELAQRLLIERFLLEPIRPVAAGPPPIQDWPWEESLMGSDTESYLPPLGLAGSPLGTLDEGMGESLAELPETDELVRLQEDSPELFQKAREIIREGVDERRMAMAVGAGGVLLRATFDSERRLLWSALRSDGRSVRVVALGGGDAGDLEKLRWATVRHDFRMALARIRTRKTAAMRVQGVLGKVRESLEALQRELRNGGSPQALAEHVERMAETLFSPDQPGSDDLLRLLVPVLSLLQSAPDSEDFADWASDFSVGVEDLLNRLFGEGRGSLLSNLDRITSEFIDEVRRVWDLEGLTEALTPDTDLVVQLDDALHAVPIAYLPVAGEPLFQRVRSIRSSMALLLTTLQLESEEDVRERGDKPGRLLSVSYLREGDHARDGALWLQHGFSVLADRHGLEAYAAADQPPGSAGLLRKALEDFKRFHVLAVCGHGDYFKAGVELAPVEGGDAPGQLWQGEGCNLGGVDWLWMVSCSIGRLGQNGDRDVEGFCVRLALHRARSVAAFRWPVHSAQAVALVNESVHLYLESLRSADARCLRAWALNEARKRFFAESPSLVGLNTAAACELFGLG